MTQDLTELAAAIGEEISLGQDLLDNLSAQRKAILGWEISTLIERIESREALLLNLGAVEEKRQRIVSRLGGEEANPSLQGILGRASSAAEATELGRLREQARRIYVQLQAEEKSLLSLMENLLGHIREALSPLILPEVRLYGEQGAAGSSRPSSGLIQGKI
ncbi:MAG: flagellar export chaperone FlgN [Gammaproteobacteria bacterium]